MVALGWTGRLCGAVARLWACPRCQGRAELDGLRQRVLDQALEREKSLQSQIRDLQNKLTALADIRAQQASARAAAPQTAPDPTKSRSLQIPSYVAALTGGGHLNLKAARERVSSRQAGIGRNLPPVVG
jgi:hypothetical protein